MRAFSVRIDIGDSTGEHFESVHALVDTGATNSVVPESILNRLGVKPYRTSTFQLADGTQRELPVGRTWVKVDGQQEFTQVVFGGADSGPILGAVTLEEMGLAVDPVARRLVRVTKYLMEPQL